MYEATLSHVHALCTLLPLVSSHGAQDECLEALVRARIVWYGHVLDGVTNGLRGGRLILYAPFSLSKILKLMRRFT